MDVSFGGQRCWLAVISADRSSNVRPMHELLGRSATWYVPALQRDDYAKEGAFSNRHDDRSLSGARNAAMRDAWQRGLICLQLDDDLKKIQFAVDGRAHDATADEAFGHLLARLELSDFMLGGVAPTNNAYFSRTKASSSNLFVVGSCCAIKRSEPRWDVELPLKEDYAFTAEHILAYGGVMRCDDILLTFQHYSNAGGAVARRTEALEQEVIGRLMARYPGMIKPHPRRRNEVLLRAPRAQRTSL